MFIIEKYLKERNLTKWKFAKLIGLTWDDIDKYSLNMFAPENKKKRKIEEGLYVLGVHNMIGPKIGKWTFNNGKWRSEALAFKELFTELYKEEAEKGIPDEALDIFHNNCCDLLDRYTVRKEDADEIGAYCGYDAATLIASYEEILAYI